MFLSLAHIIVAVMVIIVLYYAYFKNSILGKLAAFVILAGIVVSQLFSGFAGLIADVEFLNFLESIFRGIASLVIYAELVVLVILVFFSKFKSKENILNGAIIVYIIFVLLLQFNVFR